MESLWGPLTRGTLIGTQIDRMSDEEFEEAAEIDVFLTHIAVAACVPSSTQKQAASAISFLYSMVLEVDRCRTAGVVRAVRPEHLPVMLTREEVRRVTEQLDSPFDLIACLPYGSGLRLLKCLRLRVKDIDFGRHEITGPSREWGQGPTDHIPLIRKIEWEAYLRWVRHLHECDLSRG